MDMSDYNEMVDLYGPEFKYSEFKIGQHITYGDQGNIHTGEILWIAAPQNIGDAHLPYHLIVARDMPNGLTSFPDVVYRTDVLPDSQPTSQAHYEPHNGLTLNNGDGTYDCKDCGGTHPMYITVCPEVRRMREEL